MRVMVAQLPQSVFGNIALFSGLTPAELAGIISIAVKRSYAAGDQLFSEGDPCTGLFVIAGGAVKIVKTAPSGRQIMLAVERAPSTVAEVPLFDGGVYPASVFAIEDTTAYVLPLRDFQSLCLRHPDVSLKFLAVVGRRLRHLVSLVERVTFGGVRQRLAQALIDFAQQAGSDSFTLPATHEELAQRLGTVREVISRNLGRFQGENLIRMNRREVEILNLQGLQAEAETEL